MDEQRDGFGTTETSTWVLNPSLVITRKRKKQPKITHNEEQLKPPVQNMQNEFDNMISEVLHRKILTVYLILE